MKPLSNNLSSAPQATFGQTSSKYRTKLILYFLDIMIRYLERRTKYIARCALSAGVKNSQI